MIEKRIESAEGLGWDGMVWNSMGSGSLGLVMMMIMMHLHLHLCKHGSVTLPANLHIYRIWFVYYAFTAAGGATGWRANAAKWVIVIFRHLHAATSCASVSPTSALGADERWRCRMADRGYRSETTYRRMTARHRIALAGLTSSLVRLIATVWQPLSDK